MKIRSDARWLVAGLCALHLVVSTSPASGAPACSAASSRDTLPLVELYTSEGCDSCPPADRWLSATYPAGGTATASVLAFHVDYWDRLGWKDRFASPQFTARQYASMRANGATFVYTPQVLVQGRDVDSTRRSHAADAALAARSQPTRAMLRVDAAGFDEGPTSVRVRASVADKSARKDAALWLAYTDSGLSSDVKAGENRGVRLTHDHVVRSLYGPYPVDEAGEVVANVAVTPPSERGRFPSLVAFVQNGATGEVLQTLTLPACPRS
ncbi:MAG TPA: DUF1223 domain-containing protein [Casimicrobiaceae bacterium]|nr:DUF1223 domain-containing protein [Casimicrobiaceae bacterium]